MAMSSTASGSSRAQPARRGMISTWRRVSSVRAAVPGSPRYRQNPAGREPDRACHRALQTDPDDAPVAAGQPGRPPRCRPRRCARKKAPRPRCTMPGLRLFDRRDAGQILADQRASQPPSTLRTAPWIYFRGRRRKKDRGLRRCRRPRPIGRPECAPGSDLLRCRIVPEQGFGVVGRDIARRDGVDVDPLGGPLVGKQPGYPRDAVLRRGIGWHPYAALEATAARRC
jgi:hypothetical protein